MCIGGRLYGLCCQEPRERRSDSQHWRSKYDTPKPKTVHVPLTGVVVEAKVEDFLAEVVIKQRYENVEKYPIEALYEFPLAEGASVSAFYALVDGKKVDGKLKEKEEARDDYDDAIAGGHSAFLLEEGKLFCPTIFVLIIK